ncbi:MAG TPA: glutamyl-tRNA reductase [Syntrophomonadaceae bacterium]|nr:glutamyl-tRNA reductase [Syntrophomonadaceae bacterium]
MAGLNHKTAPVEIREHFTISGAKLSESYLYLNNRPGIEGAVILDTCNRMEIYATSKNIEEGTKALEDFLVRSSGFNPEYLEKYIYQPSCYDTIAHLFRVTSGLESMILGETQILGQVSDSYDNARKLKSSDGVLNSLFQRAIYVGKKVRTETGIDSHPVSVSYAAVNLAKNIFGSLENKTVMVIGAGEMSELTTKYLMQNGVSSVIVSNRSYEKAVQMAEEFNGRAVKFDKLSAELLKADIVISCTAANHYVVKSENSREILQNRNGKKIVLVDIAVPRDIDPSLQDIDGVHIYDIDDLKNVVDANYFARKKAAGAADIIINTEIEKFNEWLASLYVIPVIASLKQKGEAIKQQEIQRAYNRLGELSDRDKKVITSMASSIVNQLLNTPVVNLKNMATSNEGHLYAEVVKNLFDLEEEELHEENKVGN